MESPPWNSQYFPWNSPFIGEMTNGKLLKMDHRNSGFTHWKYGGSFQFVFCMFTRGYRGNSSQPHLITRVSLLLSLFSWSHYFHHWPQYVYLMVKQYDEYSMVSPYGLINLPINIPWCNCNFTLYLISYIPHILSVKQLSSCLMVEHWTPILLAHPLIIEHETGPLTQMIFSILQRWPGSTCSLAMLP